MATLLLASSFLYSTLVEIAVKLGEDFPFI